MNEIPVLYSFRRCPYAMRARIAILLSRFSCELREVVLSKKPVEMIRLSSKATVPVLLLPAGTVIDESLDVMKHVLARNDRLGIFQGYKDNKHDMDSIVCLFDDKFKYHLDRYKYASRYRDVNSFDHREMALHYIKHLNI